MNEYPPSFAAILKREPLLEGCQTFSEVLQTLYGKKHTGHVIVHFAQGHAVTVEVPGEPERKKLASGEKSA